MKGNAESVDALDLGVFEPMRKRILKEATRLEEQYGTCNGYDIDEDSNLIIKFDQFSLKLDKNYPFRAPLIVNDSCQIEWCPSNTLVDFVQRNRCLMIGYTIGNVEAERDNGTIYWVMKRYKTYFVNLEEQEKEFSPVDYKDNDSEFYQHQYDTIVLSEPTPDIIYDNFHTAFCREDSEKSIHDILAPNGVIWIQIREDSLNDNLVYNHFNNDANFTVTPKWFIESPYGYEHGCETEQEFLAQYGGKRNYSVFEIQAHADGKEQ